MKYSRLRIISVIVVFAFIFISHITFVSIGTYSAFGWRDLALLCPLGALTTMLASKMLVPRALISLAVAIVVIILVGRAFCSWVCPVPLVSKIPKLFQKPDSDKQKKKETEHAKAGCDSCTTCAEKRSAIDSRHIILGSALLSALIFGFPVFCFICPIGLTIATVLLVVQLFAVGETTWTLLLVPTLLIVEVVFFRKWCSKICPLAAFMSLVSKFSIGFKPRIDKGKCIETARGKKCGICAKVCPERIDLRDLENSYTPLNECTNCFLCVEKCPTKALKKPFLPQKGSFFRSVGKGRGDVSEEKILK